MIKVLPVNLNNSITGECWTFLRLVAILSDKKYFPWYFEKFNYYYVNERFDFSYDNGDFVGNLCYYDEVIEFKKIVGNGNIVSTVINEINKGAYIILYCDRFYVKGSPEYQKDHRMHDMLLYGYDTSLKIFNFIDININGVLWGEHTICFEKFTNAYESSKKMISEAPKDWLWLYYFNLPAAALYLNKNFNRGPRLEVFFRQMESCLSGSEVLTHDRTDTQIAYRVKRYGISAYKSYYEDLCNILTNSDKSFLNIKGNEYILHKMRSFVGSKYVLADKLKYLNETGLVVIPENIIENAQRLCKMLENAFLLMAKFSNNLDANTLKKAKTKFIEAEASEIDLLTIVKDILYDYIKKRLFEW